MKLSAQKEESLTKAGLAASVVAALAASICCIGPIAAAFLGLTSFGAFVRYEAYRPFLAVITLGLLGSAFYLAYRRQETSCESGSLCARRGVNRSVLWVVTVFVLVILTFPTWSNWVLG